MKVGMLWFDNDPKRALAIKVSRAADYYQHKYGANPDLCMVHPTMLENRPTENDLGVAKINIRPNRTIAPGHLWIGREEG